MTSDGNPMNIATTPTEKTDSAVALGFAAVGNDPKQAAGGRGRRLNVLDLFSGAGGLGYGFEVQPDRYKVACANELEPAIAATFTANFPDTTVVVGDITQDDVKARILAEFEGEGRGCDLIVGGPPCVAYSLSGKRDSRDPRGALFRDYVELVRQLQPSVFLMENVKGILTMTMDKDDLTPEQKVLADAYYALESQKTLLTQQKESLSYKKQKGEFDPTVDQPELDRIKKELEAVKRVLKKADKDAGEFRTSVPDKIIGIFDGLGYHVEKRLLNTANYGVPQCRERVIFIGVKKSLGLDIEYPEHTHSAEGGDGLHRWMTVREAIADLEGAEEDIAFAHQFTKHSPAFVEKIRNTPLGKSVNPKYTEAFFRAWPDRPSGTIKSNNGGVLVHYDQHRVMTPRELARLQSFPDSFVFKSGKSSILKQLGNAVPVGLSVALEKVVAKMLGLE